ncbi:hypothetical protein [Hymenobacter lucidus]|uniref:Lipocalin-like domain-containing protein n=1 Tax=Hymenobacter lucidus TaxID=2880930 RepID=A0ABS8ARU5_9BACT|nr:hypothetical protein [Hymenobacter lucidus]MCB2408718.1 hypothetical protein [Hymenobacter lucidus]
MNYQHFLGGLLAGAALLAACSHDQPQQQHTAPTTSTITSPADSATAVTAATPATVSTPPVATTTGTRTVYQLLQGKWQSTADEKAVVEFQGHQYIDYYDNERLTSNPFVLDKACAGENGAGSPGDNERYLVVAADDMCWHIAVVDDSSLELEYIAGGKVLTYQKIQ